MEMIVDFPGGARVDAHFGPYTVKTDQPPAGGGEGSEPTPFALFLSSLATCGGIFVLNFCKQRNLSTDKVKVVLRTYTDPATRMVGKVDLEIQVPPDFPERYYSALIRSAELCSVKRHLENPPEFNTYTQIVE